MHFFDFFVVEKNGQNGQKWPKNGQKWEISVRKGFMWPRNAFLREKKLPKMGGSKIEKMAQNCRFWSEMGLFGLEIHFCANNGQK